MKSIGHSKNGVEVRYDPIHSHAATHLEDTSGLEDLIREIISQLSLDGHRVAADFDMGRIIGTADVVEVGPSDQIVYGVRKNREDEGLVPFTKSRPGDPTSFVTLQLAPTSDGVYTLESAWIGTWEPDEDQPSPQSPNATPQSIPYWTQHAFVYGSQEIIPGTETNICPWAIP